MLLVHGKQMTVGARMFTHVGENIAIARSLKAFVIYGAVPMLLGEGAFNVLDGDAPSI